MNEQNDQIESGGVAGPIGSPTPDQVGATASQSLAVEEYEEARRVAEDWLDNDVPPQARHDAVSLLARACLALLDERSHTDSATQVEESESRGPGIEGEAGE